MKIEEKKKKEELTAIKDVWKFLETILRILWQVKQENCSLLWINYISMYRFFSSVFLILHTGENLHTEQYRYFFYLLPRLPPMYCSQYLLSFFSFFLLRFSFFSLFHFGHLTASPFPFVHSVSSVDTWLIFAAISYVSFFQQVYSLILKHFE